MYNLFHLRMFWFNTMLNMYNQENLSDNMKYAKGSEKQL